MKTFDLFTDSLVYRELKLKLINKIPLPYIRFKYTDVEFNYRTISLTDIKIRTKLN